VFDLDGRITISYIFKYYVGTSVNTAGARYCCCLLRTLINKTDGSTFLILSLNIESFETRITYDLKEVRIPV